MHSVANITTSYMIYALTWRKSFKLNKSKNIEGANKIPYIFLQNVLSHCFYVKIKANEFIKQKDTFRVFRKLAQLAEFPT